MAVRRHPWLVLVSTFTVATTLHLAAPPSAIHAQARPSASAPTTLNAHQQLARDIYKELVEINTTTDAEQGGTTRAAEAMVARLRAAGFPASDVQVVSSGPRDGNLVARLRGSGASRRKPILLLAHLDVVFGRIRDRIALEDASRMPARQMDGAKGDPASRHDATWRLDAIEARLTRIEEMLRQLA